MNQPAPVRLALFGQPVANSQSPRIHALFGRQLGIDVDYRLIETGTHGLDKKLAEFRRLGGTGANLTVPLKQAGVTLCRRIDEAARAAGAVNTLRLTDSEWHGYNTDGGGLMLDFKRLGLDIARRRVLIVGAGGAVAGLIQPLLKHNPSSMVIVNRTSERAEQLADRFDHPQQFYGGGFGLADENRPFDVLIQATSAGHARGLPPVKPAWLAGDGRVYDLNYGPAHQPFANWCREQAIEVSDGLGMLVGQAALAFEIWTGRRPQIAPVLAELLAE